MKLSQLVGLRFKETPSDCQIASHILLLRGGYIKNVASGIFSLLPPARRIVQNIERILREEMDAIGGQEVLLPVALPAALWKESGRYESVGSELLRFSDRVGNDMLLGMTHEEAVVHLARDAAQSYADYPFMLYQIQTKFRDEPRARGGLIRTREFTMKDAYSFHCSQADLDAYYARAHLAYERIFARCGLPQVIAVQSDSGMMGGKIAHEFMLPTEVGEDYLALCTACDYRSNMEIAACCTHNEPQAEAPLARIATPGVCTIDALCALLGKQPEQCCKAVLFQTVEPDRQPRWVATFVRGDLDVNEIKLRNHLGCEVVAATATDAVFATGFVGPKDLPGDVVVLLDASLQGAHNLVAGANEDGYHYQNLCPARDLPAADYVDLAKIVEGGLCPQCGQAAIHLTRGIEVGNIFQLGSKYTTAMHMHYLDANGKPQTPIMGCYGIGVGRLLASICEVHHDAYGPIWPMSVAPWQVQICALRAQNEDVASAANALYAQLQAAGLAVLLDDRPVSAGVLFSDADLLGVPLRVVISPKTLQRGALELTTRDKQLTLDLAPETAVQTLQELVQAQLQTLIYKGDSA